MYRNVLKNKNVLYYLFGAGISQFGNVLTGLAFLFLAFELTQSASLTTLIAVSQAVPYLLFGLVGGAVADRINKKSLLIWVDLMRIPIVLSIVLLNQLEILTFWYLLLISFAIQSLGCFYNPAFRAVLPLITPLGDQSSVNSLLDTVTRGVQVITPIVSIWLINSGQIIHFFTVDALTFAVSALLIFRLRWKEPVIEGLVLEEKERGIFSAILSFLSWVRNESTIKKLFILTFLMVFFNTWVWQIGLLLLLLENHPTQGEELYSILMGWYGLGVILINLLIPLLWKKLTIQLYLYGSLIWGMGIFIIGFPVHLSIYFIGVLVAAAGLPLSSLSRVYLIQTYVPAQKLGRAFSFNAVLLYGSNVVSLILFGALSSFINIQSLFIFCGSMMITLSILYLLRIAPSKKARSKSIKTFE